MPSPVSLCDRFTLTGGLKKNNLGEMAIALYEELRRMSSKTFGEALRAEGFCGFYWIVFGVGNMPLGIWGRV
tara:strand:+ start:11479 stop:11694 length:216 start_codon:yes stop_codon:yes gene_type:complete